MRTINVRDLRTHLAELLNDVGAGQVVAITRRGREVARIVPTKQARAALPSRAEARAALRSAGGTVARSSVVRMREDERA